MKPPDPEVSTVVSPETPGRVPWPTIISYGAPAVGAGYMYLLLNLYVMKFSTDVLLIAPAVMGLIFAISRVWDAISDPIVGYLSDRTVSRFGRRRTWIVGSLIPISAVFVMVFSPPVGMGEVGLVTWMALGVIGFYSAMTVFFVPHLSLGAELSDNYHERSRLFGMRHAFYTIGSILALVSMKLLIDAEQESGTAVRELAVDLAMIASLFMAIMIVFAVTRINERQDFQGRVNNNPFHAFADVWRNVHARLLIVITFIENVGSAAIAVLTLYVMQYVVGAPQWAPLAILCYMIPSVLSVPMWIPLSRRYGKVKLWMFSMILTGISFGGMFSLPFIDSVEARLATVFVLAAFAGLAAGCGGTLGPSVQGDVIDYDEHLTGERKEGSYFAAWNFVYKSATGVMLLLTGFVLQVFGFMPNEEQTLTTKIAMVSLYGIFPLVCCSIGAALFSRFKLDEGAYSQIRAELDSRKIS